MLIRKRNTLIFLFSIILLSGFIVADTCTYSGSGNWNVNINDNCTISTSIDIGDYFLVVNGSNGHFSIAESFAVKASGLRLLPSLFNGNFVFRLNNFRLIPTLLSQSSAYWKAEDYPGSGDWLDGKDTSGLPISDNFDRSDNSTSLGSNWTAHSGAWGISSNEAYLASGSDGAHHVVTQDAGESDATVRVNISTIEDNSGVSFRVEDTDNMWFVEADVGNTRWRLKKIVSGVTTILSINDTDPADGDEVKIIAKNDNITVKVNGNPIFSIKDSDLQTNTLFGLWAYGSLGSARWDDFKISKFSAQFGSTSSEDTNDPQYLDYTTGNAYVRHTGASDHWVDTPDSVANSVTGNIDLQVKVKNADWGQVRDFYFGGKFGDGRSWFFMIEEPDQILRLSLYDNGGLDQNLGRSSIGVSFTSNETGWVRATFNDTSNVAQFFTSENGTGWVQLGTNITINTAGIFDSDSEIAVGTRSEDAGRTNYARTYLFKMFDGIEGKDGNLVLDFNPNDYEMGGGYTWDSLSTGETWTLHVAGTTPNIAVIDRPSMDLHDDDYFLVDGTPTGTLYVARMEYNNYSEIVCDPVTDEPFIFGGSGTPSSWEHAFIFGAAVINDTLTEAEKTQLCEELTIKNLLLDDYPGAEIALSLRQLDNDYTGNAIKVRRSNDSVEQEIGFDDNGNLDESNLLSFVGTGNDGFITVWYDQSGNENNAVQSTISMQPQIVSSGSILYSGGKPTINFNGSTLLDAGSINELRSDNFTTYSLTSFANTGTIDFLYGMEHDDGFNKGHTLQRDINEMRFEGYTLSGRERLKSSTGEGYASGGPFLFSLKKSGKEVILWDNASIIINGTLNNDTLVDGGKTIIGGAERNGNPVKFSNGNTSEIIMYASPHAITNINYIRNNIREYYTIA